MKTKVDGHGNSWFSLVCEDGTGIQFNGSTLEYASYGAMDETMRVTSPEGTAVADVDLNYTYKAE